jgi:hypothetical protein
MLKQTTDPRAMRMRTLLLRSCSSAYLLSQLWIVVPVHAQEFVAPPSKHKLDRQQSWCSLYRSGTVDDPQCRPRRVYWGRHASRWLNKRG